MRRLLVGLLVGCGALRAAATSEPAAEDVPAEDGGGGPGDDTVVTDGGRKKPPTKEAGAPADGSSVSTKGSVEIIASGFSQPQELALSADTVVFTLRFDTALVRSVPKDGQNENEVIVPYDAAGGENAVGRSVAMAGNDVVWMNGSATGSINVVPLGGGTSRRIRWLDHPTNLTAHGGSVFFSEEAFTPSYAVQRVQLDGGSPSVLDLGEVRVGGIAVDASGVYWTMGGPLAAGKAAVRMQPLGAPDASVTRDLFLGTKTYEMGGLALSNDAVFWAEEEPGRVRRVAKAGGETTTLAEGLTSPRRVALDDTHVWITTASTVSRVPLAGGAVEDFVTEVDEPIGLAVDATHVYWAASGSGEIGRIHK